MELTMSFHVPESARAGEIRFTSSIRNGNVSREKTAIRTAAPARTTPTAPQRRIDGRNGRAAGAAAPSADRLHKRKSALAAPPAAADVATTSRPSRSRGTAQVGSASRSTPGRNARTSSTPATKDAAKPTRIAGSKPDRRRNRRECNRPRSEEPVLSLTPALQFSDGPILRNPGEPIPNAPSQ